MTEETVEVRVAYKANWNVTEEELEAITASCQYLLDHCHPTELGMWSWAGKVEFTFWSDYFKEV